MNKIDCIGETCSRCLDRPSCLRVAILTKHGELADYTDICHVCAKAVADEACMARSDFSEYVERENSQKGKK